jgi:hypothetical protein
MGRLIQENVRISLILMTDSELPCRPRDFCPTVASYYMQSPFHYKGLISEVLSATSLFEMLRFDEKMIKLTYAWRGITTGQTQYRKLPSEGLINHCALFILFNCSQF